MANSRLRILSAAASLPLTFLALNAACAQGSSSSSGSSSGTSGSSSAPATSTQAPATPSAPSAGQQIPNPAVPGAVQPNAATTPTAVPPNAQAPAAPTPPSRAPTQSGANVTTPSAPMPGANMATPASPGPGNSVTPGPAVKQTTRGPEQEYKECLNLWDAATHMTKPEWAATCRRIQNRLNDITAQANQVSVPNRRRAR